MRISDDERRARIGVRHAIAPAHRVADADAATRAVTVLHATEPATVFLSLQARADDLDRSAIEHELYERRQLVKQLAMRRTLWLFPHDLLGAAWGSASARVLAAESARIAKDVEKLGLHDDGAAWLDDVRRRVITELDGEPDGVTAIELRERVPQMVELGPTYGRVLVNLGLSTDIMRGRNTQHWRLSRPRWIKTAAWLHQVPEPTDSRSGYAELVRRWLVSFGPGTEDDIVWWLGATKGAVRTALADVGAVAVETSEGPAWVSADDPILEGTPTEIEPWAALLPVLDPTTMGWKQRDFYLGEHARELFDYNGNGNAGTTAWWNGRVVGLWTQDQDGEVLVHPLEKLHAEATSALRTEAARLTRWLEGEVVGTVYPSFAMRAARNGELTTYPVLRG